MKIKWAIITAVTVIALIASLQWGMVFLHWPLSHLWGGNETGADKVQQLFPHHITNPERFRAETEDEVTAHWIMAETKARMAIIWTIWAITVTAVAIRMKKTHSQQSVPAYVAQGAPSAEP